MSVKRILITAGGTGGHVFPAQGLAQQLAAHKQSSNVLFVAGGLKKNRFFDHNQFSFEEIACSPILSKNPFKMLKGCVHLLKGFAQSRQILKKFQPDVVVGFGSYYTVSTLLAARSLKIPIILHEANSVPGKANQWLSYFAQTVALHFPSTASLLKKNTHCVEVGLPLRQGYERYLINKEEALIHFNLSPGRQTWLVCGGSQGAKAINRLIEETLPDISSLPIQFIHLTGHSEDCERLQKCYEAYQIPACVKPFESQMQLAWRAADTFIGRAGASTIAESIEFEVPGILIPYPYATDQHQNLNADFLVETVKAGYKRLEENLNASLLSIAIQSLTQTPQLETFQWAFKCYKQQSTRKSFCDLILANGQSHV